MNNLYHLVVYYVNSHWRNLLASSEVSLMALQKRDSLSITHANGWLLTLLNAGKPFQGGALRGQQWAPERMRLSVENIIIQTDQCWLAED
jgi:hypothetical protein